MKDTILISREVGPETNPKDSGDYCTREDGRFFEAFFDGLSNKWFEYETLTKGEYGEECFPETWYEEVSKEDYGTKLIKKGFEAARELDYEGPCYNTETYSTVEDFLNQRSK
jgi:hypothetical protein